MSTERSRIGVARTRKKRGQPRRGRTSASRKDNDGKRCGNTTQSATVDHFTILRNGRQVPGGIGCQACKCLAKSSARPGKAWQITRQAAKGLPNYLPQLVFVARAPLSGMILPSLENREQAGFGAVKTARFSRDW